MLVNKITVALLLALMLLLPLWAGGVYVHEYSGFSVVLLFINDNASVQSCDCLASDQLDIFFEQVVSHSPSYKIESRQGYYYLVDLKAPEAKVAEDFFRDVQDFLNPAAIRDVYEFDCDDFSLKLIFNGNKATIETCNCMGFETFEDFFALSYESPSYEKIYEKGNYAIVSKVGTNKAVEDFFQDIQDYLDSLSPKTNLLQSPESMLGLKNN